MQNIFYSWQSDLPNSTNRGFIEDCLEKAIKELRAEGAVHIDPSPDRDTQGVPGSPDIAETIFEKIDNCAAFVGDVSFVNGSRNADKVGCDCTRLMPNPNVCCEWGRATRSVDFERIISVLNLASGKVEDLPFDMRKRSVVTYHLREGEEKTDQRKAHVGKLKSALKGVLELPRTALSLEFGDVKHEQQVGLTITVKGEFLEPLPEEEIPLLSYPVDDGVAGAFASFQNSQLNEDYYMEKANYILVRRLARPMSLVVQNAGDRLLRNVRLEAWVQREDGDGLLICEHLPEIPKKDRAMFDFPANRRGLISEIRGKPLPGDVAIKQLPNRHKIEVFFGDVQSKASAFSDEFYAASAISRQIEVSGLLYADELGAPEETRLTVIFETEQRKMTMDDITKRLPEQGILADSSSGEIIEHD